MFKMNFKFHGTSLPKKGIVSLGNEYHLLNIILKRIISLGFMSAHSWLPKARRLSSNSSPEAARSNLRYSHLPFASKYVS